MILAQLGGIGMVTFATFFATFLTKGVGLKHQSIIQDHLSSESLNSAKDLLRKVIVYTLVIEAVGAVGIFFTWDEYLWDQEHQFASFGDKLFFSVFHSISAFCNAGFSLFSGGLDDADYSTGRMFNLHLVIIFIIILGGLGFTTLEDIFSWNRIKSRLSQPWRTYSISSKIVLKATFWLIFIGFVGFFMLEFYQLRDRTISEAIITALFQSVTTRTAGFNTMDFGALKDATVFMVLVLMFIGAASGSTAGGLKITTFVLTILGAIATIRRQERVMLYKRMIPDETIRKAFAIFMFAIAYNAIAIFLLVIVETPEPDEKRFVLKIIFEQVSAFATVGLSMGYTGNLTFAGKVIIILSMYLGRVGTLTLAIALSNAVVSNSYRYPTAHVMVG
jgi:Trk-type K+ transport system membrane component